MCRIGPMLEKIGEPDDVKALGYLLRLIFELLLLSLFTLMDLQSFNQLLKDSSPCCGTDEDA